MTRYLPAEIKRVTKQDLLDLTDKARRLHLGAGRRPEWILSHVSEAAAGCLRADLHESSPQPCYRCLIVVERADNTVEQFPLDVVPDDFTRLPTVNGPTLLQVTRWALGRIPISPLPPEDMAEWNAHRSQQRPP